MTKGPLIHLIAIFHLGLTDTVALLANEARYFRFRVIFGACSLQNEVCDPQFFAFLAKVDITFLGGKFKKNLWVGTFGRERP